MGGNSNRLPSSNVRPTKERLNTSSRIAVCLDMSPARKLHILEQEEFERLLKWLDPDPERAGSNYEEIRWRLIAILASRGCRCPEELADETIDRVARRVGDIQDTYVGQKALYFLGVMNNVHHEYLKRPALLPPPVPRDDVEAKEKTHSCLEKCLQKLAPNSRKLIEQYYSANKQARIDLRKLLAREFGIGVNTLRLRALRIRGKLQTCIEQCLELESF
jgi:DNA-directed RNA polymerase specialized sigma24 family protein